MFVKEWRDNLRPLIIWCIVLTALYGVIFIIYPTIMKEYKSLIDQIIEMLPKETTGIFKRTDIATPSGWLRSEGLIYLVIFGAIYSALLGSNCVYSEKKDKTIEYLATRPVTRTEILIKKALADILCIGVFTLVNSAVIFTGLAASKETELFPTMLYITLTLLISFLVFWVISLFISIVYKGSFGIAFGFSLVFYVFILVTKLTDKIDFLKYFGPFTLNDTANIAADEKSSTWPFIAGAILFLILGLLSVVLYNKKEPVR